MKILLNGAALSIESNTSVQSLLLKRGIDCNSVVVEYNLSILGPSDWSNTVLKENDSIEVLRFVGGG